MKTTTGIQDDEELKRHIIAVQTKAFAVRPSGLDSSWPQGWKLTRSLNLQLYKYPCIRMFEFMRCVQGDGHQDAPRSSL